MYFQHQTTGYSLTTLSKNKINVEHVHNVEAGHNVKGNEKNTLAVSLTSVSLVRIGRFSCSTINYQDSQ